MNVPPPNKQTSSTQGTQEEVNLAAACSLASGMLFQDLSIFFTLWVLLSLPTLIVTTYLEDLAQVIIPLRCLEHILEIAALCFIGHRWIGKLSVQPRAFKVSWFLTLIILGSVLWLTLTIPVTAQFANIPADIKMFFLLLLIPGVFLNLRYFFYFAAPLLGRNSLSQILSLAGSYTEKDPWLGIKILLAPAGVSILLASLFSAIAPDERSLLANNLASSCEALLPLLSAYLGTAVLLLRLPDNIWHQSNLDPYRKARLTTISMQGTEWFAKILTPKKGLTMILLSALVWSGNLLRLSEMPPAANISVKQIEIENEQVRLTLEVKDETYHLRGFRPIFFALGGESRTLISRWPESATQIGMSDDLRLQVPLSSQPILLTLNFKADRSGKDLAMLEDLHLWYRNVKLSKLDLKTAKIIEKPQQQPEQAAATP